MNWKGIWRRAAGECYRNTRWCLIVTGRSRWYPIFWFTILRKILKRRAILYATGRPKDNLVHLQDLQEGAGVLLTQLISDPDLKCQYIKVRHDWLVYDLGTCRRNTRVLRVTAGNINTSATYRVFVACRACDCEKEISYKSVCLSTTCRAQHSHIRYDTVGPQIISATFNICTPVIMEHKAAKYASFCEYFNTIFLPYYCCNVCLLSLLV